MRVVICWSQISGYMAACWRELQSRNKLDLQIVAFKSGTDEANFSDGIVAGLPITLLDSDQRENQQFIDELVIAHTPDVLVVPGWLHRPYSHLVRHPKLASTRFVMAMDTPWQGTFRQTVAPWLLNSYLKKMDMVIVAGERTWLYALWLGIPETRLRRGVYGIDYASFSKASVLRSALPAWPRSFYFSGRYVEVKGLDILVDAYQKYRKSTAEPWKLEAYGQGPMKPLLDNVEGITDFGFVQPNQLGNALVRQGAMVMSSRFEPWGAALAEAAASGLPILCTDACGANVEIVRDYFNGRVVSTDDPDRFAEGMLWLDQHYADLPTLGRRSQDYAAAFSAEIWADRWLEMFFELASRKG